MKFKSFCNITLMFIILLYNGCSGNPGDVLSAGMESSAPDFSTPVIFIHGLSSIGGDTFYNMYEKFASSGFPESKMSIPLLPRINTGTFDADYAWYTPVSPLGYNASHWKANYDNADVLKAAIDGLAPGAGEKVNLVGHSNGSAVILKLLAKYPSYASKIKKIVFISGFADVSGADGLDNIVSDLNNCMPFKNLPPEIRYYAISSESDANIALCETVYGKPSNDNPAPFGDTIRYWRMDDGDRIREANCSIPGMDHQAITTCDETIARVFEWLTGTAPVEPAVPVKVAIGGRIVIAGSYSQQGVSSGSVKLDYYDPVTGCETGHAGGSSISPDGRYSISDVKSSAYLKMTVQANGGISVYFFADRITNNSSALDFNAPESLTADKTDGMVSVNIMCRYSYLSSAAYSKRRADSFSGGITAEGCADIQLDSSCLPQSGPSVYLSTNLKNYGSTDTTTGTGNTFNFDPDLKNNYASKDVFITADLQSTGIRTVIKINGADRMNNIRNYIVYLYR